MRIVCCRKASDSAAVYVFYSVFKLCTAFKKCGDDRLTAASEADAGLVVVIAAATGGYVARNSRYSCYGRPAVLAAYAGSEDYGFGSVGRSVSAEAEIAETVGDIAPVVAFDSLKNMRVMTDDKVGAGINHGMSGFLL